MNRSESRSSSPKQYHVGIKWKMYFILIVFIGIVVGVIWFFQIRMLNYFYQVTKFNELELTASEIASEMGRSTDAEELAQRYATEYYTDIWTYRISSNGDANLLFEVKGTGEQEISFLPRKFSVLHDKAVANGGVYTLAYAAF